MHVNVLFFFLSLFFSLLHLSSPIFICIFIQRHDTCIHPPKYIILIFPSQFNLKNINQNLNSPTHAIFIWTLCSFQVAMGHCHHYFRNHHWSMLGTIMPRINFQSVHSQIVYRHLIHSSDEMIQWWSKHIKQKAHLIKEEQVLFLTFSFHWFEIILIHLKQCLQTQKKNLLKL